MEKYGQIPKKFTAAWFDYVWEYYKWHIIAVIAIVASIVYTCYTFATRIEYDLQICFASNNFISEEAQENLISALSEKIEDVNGDGEKNIQILEYSVSPTNADGQFVAAMQTKFQLELQASDTYLFIISKDRVDTLLGGAQAEGLFASTSEWTTKESTDGYFIQANEGDLLSDSGIVYSDLYMTVRNHVAAVKSKNSDAFRNNAILAAKAIAGE